MATLDVRGAPGQAEGASDPDFMLSLARGLAVLHAFERQRALTTSQASTITGLPRATVRRCLHTLARLGYVAPRDGAFVLRPAVLPLAHAYLASISSADLVDAARPLLERVRDRVGESCSLGVYDGGDVVYVARAGSRRLMSIALHVGSRVPAYCTSMGRVLLAQLPVAERDAYLAGAPFPNRAPATRTAAGALRTALAAVARNGFALVDQELEEGLRSIAVPIHGPAGAVVAAMNVGAPAARLSCDALRGPVLAELRDASAELAATLRAG